MVGAEDGLFLDCCSISSTASQKQSFVKFGSSGKSSTSMVRQFSRLSYKTKHSVVLEFCFE